MKPVYNAAQGVPFQSIGILRTPDGGYGTAQLLRNKDGCKYLITCGHNFVGNNGAAYNLLDKLAYYTFELPRFYSQFKPLRYKMEKLQGFKIKAVHIPEEYTNSFKPAKFRNPKIIKPLF